MASVKAKLADRFKLVLQQVVRQEPIYALVKVRADGRLGPQLRASSVPCATTTFGPGGVPSPVVADRPRCGFRYGAGASGTRVTVVGRTMAQLATGLQTFVERTVVDQTALTGAFDGELDFAREQRRIGPPIDAAALDAPASAVSIYTALRNSSDSGSNRGGARSSSWSSTASSDQLRTERREQSIESAVPSAD